MSETDNRSGIHLTGEDSGWPVAAAAEPGRNKDGTGADPHPKAEAYVDGEIQGAGTNEVQSVTITGGPSGGSFTLTFAGQTTAAIAHNASAATVKARLEALSNIGEGDVKVTGSAGGPYTVTFKGDLSDANVASMTASAAGLTGGTSPGVTIATPTSGSAPA
jgi:hypothetical protein